MCKMEYSHTTEQFHDMNSIVIGDSIKNIIERRQKGPHVVQLHKNRHPRKCIIAEIIVYISGC